MPSVTQAVALWHDASGTYSGALLTEEPAAAHGASEDEVLHQFKELLEWWAVHEPWSLDSDLLEAEVVKVRVEVRPQYVSSDGHRILPCPETLAMQVPCVVGRQETGLRICIVPHLSLRFQFEDQRSLKSLVGHFVGERLQGRTPLGLAGLLPPKDLWLQAVSVREVQRTRRIAALDRPEFKPLLAVAESLLADRTRRPAYGREELSSQLAQRLVSERGNLLLVGEPGVGKSTLLADAAHRSVRDHTAGTNSVAEAEGDESASQAIRHHRFWRGSGARMIAGMKYLGQWEERCEEFVAQLARIEGVFCVGQLLELVQVGGEGPGDSVAAFLIPFLQRGDLRMIAESTPKEVDACRRLLPGLIDQFQLVHVPEFSAADACNALARLAHAHASTANLDFPATSVRLAHDLFRRFQPYAPMPGPAAEFIRKLIADLGRRSAGPAPSLNAPPARGGRPVRPVVDAVDVLAAFSRRTGLPEVLIRDDVPLDLAEVRARLAREIVGQGAGVNAAAQVIGTIKAGLTDPSRPAAVLLFCGPTGVGKTALARTLARHCFGAAGEAERLVRLDLSEFAGPGAAHRLLTGARGEPAAWIQRVRAQPFCVLLLDEIEKAAPEIFDMLLSALDEGRLTDRFGRVTNLCSAVIVMTSNIGSGQNSPMGFAGGSGPDYDAAVQRFFRPEFFNRLDAVVTFNPLTPDDIRAIVRKELEALGQREGLADAELRLEWEPALEAMLARIGYDQRLGARPLQRAVEQAVAVPLARWRIANPQGSGLTLRLVLETTGTDPVQVRVEVAGGSPRTAR